MVVVLIGVCLVCDDERYSTVKDQKKFSPCQFFLSVFRDFEVMGELAGHTHTLMSPFFS